MAEYGKNSLEVELNHKDELVVLHFRTESGWNALVNLDIVIEAAERAAIHPGNQRVPNILRDWKQERLHPDLDIETGQAIKSTVEVKHG